MTTEKTVEEAIERSVSHNEIVRVEVADPFAAYEESKLVCGSARRGDCTSGFSIENDGSYDVWGTTDSGDDFRIRLVKQNPTV